MEEKYRVIYSGEVHDDFNLGKVEEGFSQLFKINLERAANYLVPNKVIKEGISYQRAQAYKIQLERIGMIIRLEKEARAFSSMMLEVELTADENENKGGVFGAKSSGIHSLPDSSVSKIRSGSATDWSIVGIEQTDKEKKASGKILAEGLIKCPKCQLEQKKASQCAGCGVYIHKFINQQAEQTEQESKFNPYQSYKKESDVSQGVSSSVLPYLAAAGTALIGAFVWMLIALKAEFEIAWVAIIIGGAIGLAASTFNKNRKDLAVMCCVLTVCSIMGGKLLYVEGVKNYIIEEMNAELDAVPTEMLRASYNQMEAEIPEFKAMMDDHAQIKQVLIHYAKSQGADEFIPLIDDYLFEYLEEHVMPYIIEMEFSKPSFEQWRAEIPGYLEGWIRNFSSFEIIKVEFDPIDWLFLILGVAAAFRVSRNQLGY